jgi:DNA invertase Pin-like site-specific DNA recombinase
MYRINAIKMCVIIFQRISTEFQLLERQTSKLTEFARSQGWTIVKTISEIGSGTTPIEKRKAIDDLKRFAIELKADKILVSDISRLGRTTSESLSIIDFMTRAHISCFEFQRRLETLNADLTVNPIAGTHLVSTGFGCEDGKGPTG